MSQDVERYLYFTVALLKDSFALDALWQDALKYHMIDQPGKLIAIRLTEYYEIMSSGVLPPVAGLSLANTNQQQQEASNGANHEEQPLIQPSTHNSHKNEAMFDQPELYYTEAERPVAASPDVAYNAEAAADYWTLL
ncbi:MAG TPA: hypothetical protein VGT82_12405 [Ktedonobacteraceae bacterium]|nr:hypothetical protein [Ktedonobacteraceae bacterium]